ncbi:antibiotic biosynthesis monooxygenase family protein [Cognatishimia maritima]|uniref:Antibiotic biosynthesis monooxygenase n=1 Tax=Cognatishimia maritima TaxID=870908 RepID=A0A1M5VYE8_9RHOB|nr:hypothetical protein [Cognatishimia maritima]SHH80227.1 hypothetical protein SAMN04488044_3318 [Cognatishimia maritima]
MANHIVETVTFKLVEGADSDAFVIAANAMTNWIETQPGFIRRRLSCTEDGTWIEHIEWADMEAALGAAKGIGTESGNAEFLKAIDGSSVAMSHSRLEVSLG